MPEPILLDTCAVIWLAEGQPMSPESHDAVRRVQAERAGVYVSPISAWEVGTLVARGRLQLAQPVETWFARFTGQPGVRLSELSAAILIRSTALPQPAPADPADRIIVATAREIGCPLVTRDRLILRYAGAGHLRAIAC